MHTPRIRHAMALASAMVALAAGVGAASTLGLSTSILAVDQVTVAPCDQAVNAEFETAYDAAAGGYVVTAVVLTGLDGTCDGQAFSVTLAGVDSASLGQATYTDPAGLAGQIQPGAGAEQRVTIDLGAQAIPASVVARLAASIAN